VHFSILYESWDGWINSMRFFFRNNGASGPGPTGLGGDDAWMQKITFVEKDRKPKQGEKQHTHTHTCLYFPA